ncbi:MAG: A/G-specific adenine glycosylase [Desulfosoma sp.]
MGETSAAEKELENGPDDRPIGIHLVEWFCRHQRPLPWRRDYAPYAVWISEIMLQQTQVAKVVPYFERWMARLPDVQAVAEAPLDELLHLWEGLGYYSRVRHVKKAAEAILSRHGGKIPSDEKALRELPGIGEYTAAAIASLAFGQDVPVLDGNAQRVAARLLDWNDPVDETRTKKALRQALGRWMPPGRAREFNQAVMELGSVVCTPKRPACKACPVVSWCRAYAAGTVAERPAKRRRPSPEHVSVAVGVLYKNGEIFIQKRPPGGLMAGLWEFPGGKLENGESPEEAVKRELFEELGVTIRVLEKVAEIRHAITRFRILLHAFRCVLDPPTQDLALRSAVEALWVPPESLGRYAFPSANRRFIRILQENHGDEA